MKRLLFFSLIISAFFLFSAKTANAITCSEFYVDPAAGAPAGSVFVVYAIGCAGLNNQTAAQYNIFIYSDLAAQNLVGSYALSPGSSETFTSAVTNITTPGHYLVTLHNNATGQNFYNADLFVQDPAPEGETTYQCQIMDDGNNYCLKCNTGGENPGCITATTNDDLKNCPAECQAVYIYRPELCNGDKGVKTAIGCVTFQSPSEFMAFFITWGIGIAGGVSILLVIYAGILIMTSAGDPKRLQGGKELMTSALVGVLLVIFSIFVMRILGVKLLGLF